MKQRSDLPNGDPFIGAFGLDPHGDAIDAVSTITATILRALTRRPLRTRVSLHRQRCAMFTIRPAGLCVQAARVGNPEFTGLHWGRPSTVKWGSSAAAHVPDLGNRRAWQEPMRPRGTPVSSLLAASRGTKPVDSAWALPWSESLRAHCLPHCSVVRGPRRGPLLPRPGRILL